MQKTVRTASTKTERGWKFYAWGKRNFTKHQQKAGFSWDSGKLIIKKCAAIVLRYTVFTQHLDFRNLSSSLLFSSSCYPETDERPNLCDCILLMLETKAPKGKCAAWEKQRGLLSEACVMSVLWSQPEIMRRSCLKHKQLHKVSIPRHLTQNSDCTR